MIARLALALCLSGCAAWTTSEADCRGMNWHQRGYDDGYFGHPPQDLRLARDCGRFGIQISGGRYLEGWRAGHDEWDRIIGSYGQD